jgi:hypothetical protein
MRRLRWTAVAACGLMLSAAADEEAGWTPVPDSALEEVRGGFDLGGSMVVSLGVERLVSINGSTVASSQFNIADVSRITASEARLAREAVPQFAVVQNGAGNSVLLPAGGGSPAMSALLIQNTINDQLIRSQTTINASVSSQALLTAMNFEGSMRAALAGALAPR